MKNTKTIRAQVASSLRQVMSQYAIEDTPSFPLAMNVTMAEQHPFKQGNLSFRFYDLSCDNIGTISVELAQIQPQDGKTSLQIGLQEIRVKGFYAIDVKDCPEVAVNLISNTNPYSDKPATPLPAGSDEGVWEGAWSRVSVDGIGVDDENYESFGQPSSKAMAMALGWQSLTPEDRVQINDFTCDDYQEFLVFHETATDTLWQGSCEAVVRGAMINLVIDNEDVRRSIRSHVELPTFDFELDDSQWQGEAAKVARQRLSQVYFVRSLLHEQITHSLKQAAIDVTRRVCVA